MRFVLLRSRLTKEAFTRAHTRVGRTRRATSIVTKAGGFGLTAAVLTSATPQWHLRCFTGSFMSAYPITMAQILRFRSLPTKRPGGKVYRYDGNGQWVDCGRLSRAEAIFGMVVYQGRLYASSMDGPNREKKPEQGLYRYDGGQEWTYCGSPRRGNRIVNLAVHHGHLYGTGYDAHETAGVYRYAGGTDWVDCGTPPGVLQSYGLAVHDGELHLGTWPNGTVFRYLGGTNWASCGRLGQEQEVMGMAVYDGKFYAGTLPLAQVYRYDGESTWALSGRLDFTSGVMYRRALSVATYRGCSAPP